MIEVMMKKILILMLLLFGQQLFATKYHLDVNTTGANTGLTKIDAWDSADSLESNVVAGDTVLWYDGVYNQAVDLDSIFAGTAIVRDTLYNIAVGANVVIDQNSIANFFLLTPSFIVARRNQKILFFRGFKFIVDQRNFIDPGFNYNMGVHMEGCDIFKTNSSNGRITETIDVFNMVDCVIDMNNTGFALPSPARSISMKSCTIVDLGTSQTFFAAALTAGELTLEDVILNKDSGTGLFLNASSDFDAISLATNVLFNNVDTTRFGTEDVAINLFEADPLIAVSDYSLLPVKSYYLSPTSPAHGEGTQGLDIGAVRNTILR